MAALSIPLSIAYLRTGLLFQPVVFDVLFWTLAVYLVVRYLKTWEKKWLVYIGLVIGLGLLNKYTVVFLAVGFVAALILTPQRRVLKERAFWWGVGAAFVVLLPNLAWQWHNDFPVLTHLQELRATQLDNVGAADFLLGQVQMHAPVLLVWLAGLWFVFSGEGQRFRLLGLLFVVVVAFMLMLGGKAYYTLGLYPMLFAAGAVWLERHLSRSASVAIFAAGGFLALLLSPVALPYLSAERMVAYGDAVLRRAGLEGVLRWEDGQIHELPQDYADMLGWEELAALIRKAHQQTPDGSVPVLFCENYGQAGASLHYNTHTEVPAPISFNDSFRLWAPRHLPPGTNALIYVGDEPGEDLMSLFGEIRLVGFVQEPYARERGTGVFLCLNPRSGFPEFYRMRRQTVLGRSDG